MTSLTSPSPSSTPLTSTPDIELSNVFKSFGDKKVLSGVSLKIGAGESFVLMGRSGCGKSVLLKCLLGLIDVDKGSLKMDGVSIVNESVAQQYERMSKIGMVFQGSALFDSLTVWENVAFRLLITHHLSRQAAYDRALETLERVQLDARVAQLLPSDLSGGMKRRVALARAIILKPKFLFLDEPTAGLDPVFSKLIAHLIRDCHQALGSVTFTITHDLHLARTIADRIGMLEEGKIVWTGSASDLSITSNPDVAAFVADD